MDDKTLLELAAEAAGIESHGYDEEYGLYLLWDDPQDDSTWNPLTSDTDAFRLAVKLGLSMHIFHTGAIFTGQTMTSSFELEIEEDGSSDPYAATRRAITRAAAEIAKANKQP